MDELTLGMVLTTAGASVVGGFIAGVVEVLKGTLLPASWSTGRAPMLLAALLAAAVTALALLDAQLGFSPGSVFVAFLTWFGVYAAAIGTHATVTKAGRVMRGTTDPAGPDDA